MFRQWSNGEFFKLLKNNCSFVCMGPGGNDVPAFGLCCDRVVKDLAYILPGRTIRCFVQAVKQDNCCRGLQFLDKEVFRQLLMHFPVFICQEGDQPVGGIIKGGTICTFCFTA